MTTLLKQCLVGVASLSLSQMCFAQDDETVWVTIDALAAKHFQQDALSKQKQTRNLALQSSVINDVNFMRVNKQDIAGLSEFMHDNYHRCGGFVAHESLADAELYTQKLNSVSQLASTRSFASYTIDNATTVNALLSSINASELTDTVNSMMNFHNRYYSVQSGVDAAQWLKNHWQQIASSRSDISVEYFNHSFSQSSVVVTIPGAEKADEIVVIGGHLDSINQSNPSNGRAPGADDNASGIAVLTQALKAIVDNNYQPQRTIQIMGFAAEEVGLRGSKDIAQSYKSQAKNVVGMVQFDMTGNNGSSTDIVMMTDYTNSPQNQYLSQLLDAYQPSVSYGFDQCGYGCSDHASWYQQGFAASMPFESRMSDINPLIHTSNDSQFDAQHASKFAKLAVSYLAEMAKNAGDVVSEPSNELENGVAKTGLSAAAKQQLFFTLEVPAMSNNLEFTTQGGTGDADLYVKFGSKPTLQDFDCKSTTSSSNESCAISSIQAGTYHVMVEAWNEIAGVALTGSYSQSSGSTPIDRTETNVNVPIGTWQRFTQAIPSGMSNLTVTISGGSGDADLYVNYGSPSTSSNYQCRPYKNGNEETCQISNPQAGTWYIDLQGYSSALGVTLTIEAQ
ncbi:M28 family metallopeptidase [Pseudoalteromonas sp. N1230-9]|uniref:M28 family metallopeptidase n=1 Tax=Pseudoalteromonas sp. N1230-9 TaxID=2907156 RepID=UPI001023069E|nr:M20/M25/M40 family metallo-hydrolase [Pseudoalteromonas sp. CO302Y]RZG06367.1 M20/M25/M40 family metallo-hydrolase [Pseudoalteromonas sp. CO133X]